jgi:hypothetical protein
MSFKWFLVWNIRNSVAGLMKVSYRDGSVEPIPVMSMKKCSKLCLSIFAHCLLLRCFPWKLLMTSIHLSCMDISVKIKCMVCIRALRISLLTSYLFLIPSHTSRCALPLAIYSHVRIFIKHFVWVHYLCFNS